MMSSTNGQNTAGSDVSSSSYEMLLKQVESLRKENSTLKAELKNNTSHISKLEGEALRMKDMVLMLGNPSLTGGNLEPDVLINYNSMPQSVSEETSRHPEELSSMTLHGQTPPQPSIQVKLQNGNVQDKKHRPEFISGLSQNSSFNNNFSQSPTSSQSGLREAVSPSPTSAVADALKKTLAMSKSKRARIVGCLEQEEKIKDHYIKQFKELKSRLDNVSDSDKFTKPNDKTRNEVETEIMNLKKTMDQNLGSSEIMQERLEARLKQIQVIEKEIASVTNHINQLEKTPSSPEAASLARLHQGGIDLIAHATHSGTGPDGQWTQTPKLTSPLENMMYKEEFLTSDNQNLDFHIASSSGKMSRTVQTASSCLAGQNAQHKKSHMMESPNSTMMLRDASTGRNEIKTPGSIESLPSHSDVEDTASMHSFTTSLPRHLQSSCGSMNNGMHSPSFLTTNKEELCRLFLKMSKSVEGCISMRHSGHIQRIVQIIHDGSMLTLPSCWSVPAIPGQISLTVKNALKMSKDIRIGMAQVLRNIAHVTADSMKSKIENQILQNLEIIRCYCECLFDFWIHSQTLHNISSHMKDHKLSSGPSVMHNGFADVSNGDKMSVSPKSHDFQSGLIKIYDPPMTCMNVIMQLSHNEEIRGVINEFGGLLAVAELFVLHCRCVTTIELVQAFVGNEIVKPDEKIIIQLQLLRKLVGFALINLTFGDMPNKAALIQMPGLIDTVMSQMEMDSEEMQQVMARFMRNLSWQPDEKCREILKQKKVVLVLMKCALKSKREETLKNVLSALWNLSGHCAENRACICSVKGALGFLVSTLTYRTIAIIESGGAILRNVSSVVATNEEFRQILREKGCLQILLTHLKAASLTIVSNACGTLWNLSARNPKDQQMLWDLGAVPMLRNLVHSKHSVIAQGSSAALRNLLTSRSGNLDPNENAKREKALNIHETDKNGMISKSFPRHQSLSGNFEKLMSPRSTTNPQRHSLQETTSSSPVPDVDRARRFQKGGLHYSGSLGSLPSSDFNDLSKIHGNLKYSPAAPRNSNSYNEQHSPSSSFLNRNNIGQRLSQQKTGKNPVGFSRIGDRVGLLKDVLISTDAAVPPSQLPIQKCFQLGNTQLPLSNGILPNTDTNMQSSANQNISSPGNSYLPGRGPTMAWHNTDSPTLVPSGGPTNIPNQIPGAHSLRVPKLLVPKNSEDLVRRLHHVEEDYGYDDDTINYSLQYRDEHMTPGIQSPRTEEIYELTSEAAAGIPRPPPDLGKEYMHSQMTGTIIPSSSMNGRAPKSDGGLSGLSSCVGSTGSSVTRQEKIANRIGASATVDSLSSNDRTSSSLIKSLSGRYTNDHGHVGQSYNSQYSDLAFDDEKPKNFGAIYSEEQLYEHLPSQSYSKMEPAPLSPEANNISDSVNSVHPVDITNNKTSTNVADSDATVLESQELDDKFDSGALTPAYYSAYKSGYNSGIITPNFQNETPLIFSRCSSPGTVSDDGVSIHSSRTSEPESRMMSGRVSPSHLPDSPSMSMPVSPRRSPPPMQSLPGDIELSNIQINSKIAMEKDTLKRSQISLAVNNSNHVSSSVLPPKIEANLRKLEQPGYYSSMPHKDEMNTFAYEGAMSTMTKFSALTIDGSDKVQPVLSNQSAISSIQSPIESKSATSVRASGERSTGDLKHIDETVKNGDVLNQHDFSHLGQRAVLHAGYVTSLPTNDEIKKFVNEGTLSPMTAFSEISCIKSDNHGFQKSTGSMFSVPNTRSSATGASVPPPAPDKLQGNSTSAEIDMKKAENQDESSKDPSNLSSVTSPTTHSIDDGDEEFDDDSDSLPSSSSDDEDLLQKCIQIGQRGLPKKKNSGRGWSSKSSTRSTSSKSSSKSGKSSRSKEKVTTNSDSTKKEEERSVKNPSPEVVSEKQRPSFNVKQKLAAANMKLKGRPITEYMDNLMKKSDGNDIEDEEIKENADVSRMKKVIDNAEMLQQSYSVMKKLKEQEKQATKISQSKAYEQPSTVVSMPKTTGLLPSEPAALLQSKMRIQSYMREGMTTYATEGTPLEMSRSTSLSNLTVDSEAFDNAGTSTSQQQLKTSYSVPDIQTSCELPISLPETKVSHPVSNISSHFRSSSLGDSASMGKDSREILEVLGQQIANLSLTTAESVITSKDPGYTTSLPHTDEIFRYEAEGSQCGGTIFSALTIDSDTKIAPSIPTDIPESTSTGHQKDNTVQERILDQIVSSQQHVSRTPNSVPITNGLANEQTDYAQPNSFVFESQNTSNEVDTILNNRDHQSWPPQINESQFSSHYNNDNDVLAMREERQNYTIEDTPLNMSGHGSLSSLSLDSIDDDNDLLKECINSALPSDKKPLGMFSNQTMHYIGGSPARYNQGAPDGRVDSSLSQQAPFVVPNTMQKPIFDDEQIAGHLSTAQYTNDDEIWSMFQQNADAVAARLMQSSYHQQGPSNLANVPVSSLQSPDMQPSSSISLSQPTDGFYRLSRQASVQESDLSVSSSIFDEQNAQGRARASYQSAQQPRSHSRTRQYSDKSADRAFKGTNKPSPLKGKDIHNTGRSGHLSARNRGSSSGSSSPYRRQGKQFGSSNKSTDLCSCQVACSRPSAQSRSFDHGPVSVSTSHLVDGIKSPTRRRRQSTNSASKYSFGHQPKPNRLRNSSKNIYRPSVTQLYPPLKDMVGVLEGVASVAARGDKVVADRNPSHCSSNYGSQPLSKKSSSSSLVRSATFITEKPSSILLDSMTHEEKSRYASKSNSSMSSLSQSQHSTHSVEKSKNRAASPQSSSRSLTTTRSRIPPRRGSTHSLKEHSVINKNSPKTKTKKKNATTDQTKPKQSNIWSGIKKLLSPSEDNVKSSSKKSTSTKTTPQSPRTKSLSKKTEKATKTNDKNLTSKNMDNPAIARLPVQKKSEGSGSSLSLSSSSGSNISVSDIDVEKSIQINKNVTPYGLLPKSPSVNAISRRTISMIPQSHSASVLDQSRTQNMNPTVWRRTPLKDTEADVKINTFFKPNSYDSNHVKNETVSSKNGGEIVINTISKSKDVWVSKKDMLTMNESSNPNAMPPGTDKASNSDDGCLEGTDEISKQNTGNSLNPGFQSPPRTQSPRVVQQVAPFNYKPSPSKVPERQQNEKNIRGNQKYSHDCKHTPV